MTNLENIIPGSVLPFIPPPAFPIACSRGNPAYYICCCPKLCPYHRYMCCDTKCQGCYVPDRICMAYHCWLLRYVLQRKGYSMQTKIYQIFQKLHIQYCKSDKILQQQFHNSFMQIFNQYVKKYNQLNLFGKEKELYDLLNSNCQNLRSTQVSKVLKILTNQPLYLMNRKSLYHQQTDKYLKDFKRSVNILTQQLKDAHKTLNQFLSISPAGFIALDGNIHINQKQRRTNIKKMMKDKGDQKRLVLIDPPISDYHYLQVVICRLQITKCSFFNIGFGVIQLNNVLPNSSTFFYKHLKSGLFVQKNDFFIGTVKQHKKLQMGITQIEQLDIIQVEFNRTKSQVTVRNETKKTKSVAQIVVNLSKKLYFGIVFGYHGDEVTLLKVSGKRVRE